MHGMKAMPLPADGKKPFAWLSRLYAKTEHRDGNRNEGAGVLEEHPRESQVKTAGTIAKDVQQVDHYTKPVMPLEIEADAGRAAQVNGGADVPTTRQDVLINEGGKPQKPMTDSVAVSKPRIRFEEHFGKSCQAYAEEPPVSRDLAASKDACIASDDCQAIECPHGQQNSCTLRANPNLIVYGPADCYVKRDPADDAARVHPAYTSLLKEYPFQQVTTQTGRQVNIILVRCPFGASGPKEHERGLFNKYKNDILFMGISSFEDYPLDSMNPYSPRIDADYYLRVFPGFLHMLHHPEKHFPPEVKTILMSQSDFQLPVVSPDSLHVPKEYAFTYAATWPLGSGSSDPTNSQCMGWSGYCKNWTFTKEALEVLCGEYKLTGVLIATQDEIGNKKCSIPESCAGKIKQTSFLKQEELFSYFKRSRFAFLPQMHDASPRVATQALIHDIPLLMNKHISGGWKYVTEKTGEFFHDMSDFRDSLDKILKGTETPGKYQPRKWVLDNYGNEHSGKRLLAFVKEHFSDRVHLPKNTKLLLT